ncbi:MAG: hypothetical protein WDW36_005614 [Sanguina aurantia]
MQASALLSSPNAQIPRTVDAALRRSIPAFNPSVAKVQKNMEEISYFMRIPQRKPWGNMAASVTSALSLSREQLMVGTPPASKDAAEALADKVYAGLKRLELAVGSQQPDVTSVRVAEVLRSVAALELVQAPGLAFSIPAQYTSLPRLVGRAVVEFTLQKASGSAGSELFFNDVGGGTSPTAVVQVTLDGYSAPITAGNFMVNVLEGLYDDRPVQSTFTSIFVESSSDRGPAKRGRVLLVCAVQHCETVPHTPARWRGGCPTTPRRLLFVVTVAQAPVPLEILPAGQYEPLYRLPLDVQSGELPVLPLSITGAISMAHIPGTEKLLSGQDWFVYKFDKQQSGLAGLAFDEGTFGVFGYVSKGMDSMAKVRPGDTILQARIVSGVEKLVQPNASSAAASAPQE